MRRAWPLNVTTGNYDGAEHVSANKVRAKLARVLAADAEHGTVTTVDAVCGLGSGAAGVITDLVSAGAVTTVADGYKMVRPERAAVLLEGRGSDVMDRRYSMRVLRETARANNIPFKSKARYAELMQLLAEAGVDLPADPGRTRHKRQATAA
jgi:hypothetical protein